MNRFTDYVQFCEAVQPSSFKKDPTRKNHSFTNRTSLRGWGVRRAGVVYIASQYISLACPLNFETATSITHRDAADWKLNKAIFLVQQLVNVAFHKPPTMDDYHLFCASCRKTEKRQTTVRESDNNELVVLPFCMFTFAQFQRNYLKM